MEILQLCGLCSSMEQPSWAKGFPYPEPELFVVSHASFLLCSSLPDRRARILTAPTQPWLEQSHIPHLLLPCCSPWGSHHVHDIFLSWGPRSRCRIQKCFPECEWTLMAFGCLNASPVLCPHWAVQADTNLCWPVGTVARLGSAWSLGLSVPCPPLGLWSSLLVGSGVLALFSIFLLEGSQHLRMLGLHLHLVCAEPQAASPLGSACARAASLAGSRSLPACSKFHRAPRPQGNYPGAACAACLVLLAGCPAP